ncbi:hypothetical protein [Phormidesmis priestleyi]
MRKLGFGGWDSDRDPLRVSRRDRRRGAGSLSLPARTVLCGGLSLYLMGLSAVQWAALRLAQSATPKQPIPNRILGGRMLTTLACVVLIGNGFAPVALMGLLVLILVGVIRFQAHIAKAE